MPFSKRDATTQTKSNNSAPNDIGRDSQWRPTRNKDFRESLDRRAGLVLYLSGLTGLSQTRSDLTPLDVR
jgi:hypothetical protein